MGRHLESRPGLFKVPFQPGPWTLCTELTKKVEGTAENVRCLLNHVLKGGTLHLRSAHRVFVSHNRCGTGTDLAVKYSNRS